ncbi:hypothetical protein F442_16762 [Phytophthora nicotianae P10297]|uniref:Uncharacterized protein n=4 Tax=Phytophthora nicotianae TaxID=4792 RepID=V9EG85_PHYNI|nr:hypothetical protein F443_16923 [Phytophthora nicotianae P1569]ETK77284.1 hypothetical protein L915_16451 [Phytophthora nicotianae]ETO65798.1 hypothetical protein F444_16945 [Phytophthora nicotianae P1976]ETP35006.1 hypothetical protein F442_16762 [Phytophthora nicotianae P10297]ETL30722.1 hypothetical protein L916_16350 [Phytophthora nicotianae]
MVLTHPSCKTSTSRRANLHSRQNKYMYPPCNF